MKIHYSQIQDIISDYLVIYKNKLFLTKEDLKLMPEYITLIEIPKSKEED